MIFFNLGAFGTEEEPIASGTTAAATTAHTIQYLSSPAAATLHGKTQGFVLRLPPQHKPHATFMQHHDAAIKITIRFAASRSKPASLYTRMATPDDNNHAAIPMRSATTNSRNAKIYAHRHNHSLQNTEEEAIASGTTAAAIRRTHEVPFIAGCSHFTLENTRFRAPASSPTQLPCNIHAGQFFCGVLFCSVKSHTTLYQGQFFCDALLCRVKSHTTLHQCQFFCDVLLCSVKSHTTLHQCQFFCDALLCSVKSHTTLHQCQFFCDVLLCSVQSHTTLHQGRVSQFFLSVTRKYCFPTSFDYATLHNTNYTTLH